MIRVTFKHKGDLSKTEKFLKALSKKDFLRRLDDYGEMGVEALAAATPVDTGKTAESWSYEIHHENSTTSIVWKNSNMNNGVNIAVLLQYGHGTRNGGFVMGRDYINPAMQPVFDKIAEDAWMEVTKL